MPRGNADEDIRDASDDELGSGVRGRVNGGRARTGDTNFEVTRTWDLLDDGGDGSIQGAIDKLYLDSKKRRKLKDTTPLRRGIIRHLTLLLDCSASQLEKDLRPTRYLCMLSTTTTFIREYFEQNPISQLSIIALRNGIAEQVSDMSGNPQEHVKQIQLMVRKDAAGNPSLENGLEMARVGLKGAPSHGTREVVLVMGALYSSDPGDVHRTIESLVADKITAKVIGLAAQVAICRELVAKTNNGDTSGYSIALNEEHFKDLMLNITTPPASTVTTSNSSSLLMMGFPSRTVDPQPSLCACHGRPSREGYRCSRCSTKVCGLPAECPACGLTLILSTHLARSYHHLFPLVNWQEVPWSHAHQSQQCFACQRPFPAAELQKSDKAKQRQAAATQRKQLVGGAVGLIEPAVGRDSGSQRFECSVCHYHFCIDCDIFAHEVVHNCPGCQSGGAEAGIMGETEHEVANGDSMNGVEAS